MNEKTRKGLKEGLKEGLKRYQQKLRNGEIQKAKRPSLKKAVLAKCRECMCDYVDGRLDCEAKRCSLYFWMPYSKLKKRSKIITTL